MGWPLTYKLKCTCWNDSLDNFNHFKIIKNHYYLCIYKFYVAYFLIFWVVFLSFRFLAKPHTLHHIKKVLKVTLGLLKPSNIKKASCKKYQQPSLHREYFSNFFWRKSGNSDIFPPVHCKGFTCCCGTSTGCCAIA